MDSAATDTIQEERGEGGSGGSVYFPSRRREGNMLLHVLTLIESYGWSVIIDIFADD
jgi:hypothetical protein